MNISKISRSLVVVIFVAFIVFLSYLNITGMIKSDGTPSVSSNLIKLAYGVVLVTLVLIYVYIKDKLYKLKIKRKISFIYRYIYISIVIISTNILTIYTMFTTFSIKDIIVHMAMLSITSFVIKRIIFNVSKSDILSVFGMFLFSMLPNIIEDKSTYFVSSAIMLVMCITILFLQVTIDELKQRGLKTNKYIILSIILAIFIAICMIMGINMFFWLTIAVILFFITINLDKTHINFPKKIMNSITQAKREALYTIE
ncbi:MAG: hypothetical protein RSB76_00895, partial [Clostridia bacterium]